MKLNIEIPKDHIPEMIEFYLEKQKALKAEIAKMDKESKDISAIIIQLKQSLKNSGKISFLTEDEIYSESWPWMRKIEFAIRESGKPLTAKEVVDFLEDLDPGVFLNKRRALSSVSGTLSVKGAEFVKSVSASGENAYDVKRDEADQKKLYGTVVESIDDLPF